MVHMCLKAKAIDAPKQEDWEGKRFWSEGYQAAVNNRNVEVTSKQNVKAARKSALERRQTVVKMCNPCDAEHSSCDWSTSGDDYTNAPSKNFN